uniref:phage tail-collar fiber domain-containing protein n=1 Tax=Dialister sp. TaxID=1955814 RepID=UPI0040266A13
MAKFPSLTFTEKGLQMLVQAQNSHRLTITCGKLGAGVLTDSDDILKFTDLKAPKMTIPITKVNDSNPEKIVLTLDVSNESLEQGFASREIGIFAKLDDGAETLYAYSNAGSNYDYIPSKDTPTDENRIVVNLIVSSSANIQITIDKSIVYAHISDVEEMIATHDASDTAHETRFKLFEKIADFGNDIIKKLALTTAISAITALETNSWFGQLLKMVLTASGVRYNIADNGYVCLGSFFGGLIIQWG